MKAYLKNYRQSPRKVRLVADVIRGKSVAQAATLLEFMPQKATLALRKLLLSAVANAEHNFKVPADELIIKNVTVDEGVTYKRVKPRSRGMAHRIARRNSHVALELTQKANS